MWPFEWVSALLGSILSSGVETENGGGMSFLEATRSLRPVCRGWKDSTSITVRSV
jgi:hypothetical protein